jgi:hypothetical protein
MLRTTRMTRAVHSNHIIDFAAQSRDMIHKEEIAH